MDCLGCQNLLFYSLNTATSSYPAGLSRSGRQYSKLCPKPLHAMKLLKGLQLDSWLLQ